MADFSESKIWERYGVPELIDVYFNMMDIIEKGHMDIVELARQAMKDVGVKPVELLSAVVQTEPSFPSKGFRAPNIFTGGANFHSRFEYLPGFHGKGL